MVILSDYREKAPFHFEGYEVERTNLEVGDYSIQGLEKLIAVERKSLDDLTACMGRDRERFVNELRRARSMRCFCVIIEGSFFDLQSGRYFSSIKSEQAVASVMGWQSSFRIPFFFAGGRSEAEAATLAYLIQAEKVCRRMMQGKLI